MWDYAIQMKFIIHLALTYSVGFGVGSAVGEVGAGIGRLVGAGTGSIVGDGIGRLVGAGTGSSVGAGTGTAVGDGMG